MGSLCHTFQFATVPLALAVADTPPQYTLWIRQRGSGVDNTTGGKRQEVPETVMIIQVSQQCGALSLVKETDMIVKSK